MRDVLHGRLDVNRVPDLQVVAQSKHRSSQTGRWGGDPSQVLMALCLTGWLSSLQSVPVEVAHMSPVHFSIFVILRDSRI